MRERELVAGMAVFVSVVEGGSFTVAAKRCGLTPSAVSKLVGRLEAGFGVPLLHRTTRRMTLTDAGQTFFDRASSVLQDVRAVDQQMLSASAEPRGLVRVSASQLLGQVRVVPALLALMKELPLLSLELEQTDRVVDMVGERIDVAVRVIAEPPPSFVARRAGSIRRLLCASPAYLRTRRAPKTPRDLTDHACLAPTGPTSSVMWSFPAAAGRGPESVRVTARLRFSSTLSIYEAAKAGLGIANLPRYLVEEDLRARRLVSVLDSFETEASGVFVIYRAGPLLPARVREVANCLVRELTKTLQ